MTRRPRQLRPHRLLWVKHRYEPDDGPRDLVWYAPAVNVGRSVAVEQRLDGWRSVLDEVTWGAAYDRLEDAIADAERSIFASAYNQIIALGGWDTVAAVATAAATRPTRSGS